MAKLNKQNVCRKYNEVKTRAVKNSSKKMQLLVEKQFSRKSL